MLQGGVRGVSQQQLQQNSHSLPPSQSLGLASRAHNLSSPRATELDGPGNDFNAPAAVWYAFFFAVVMVAVALAVQANFPHMASETEAVCNLALPTWQRLTPGALLAYGQEWWAVHGNPADYTLMSGVGAVAGFLFGGFGAEFTS